MELLAHDLSSEFIRNTNIAKGIAPSEATVSIAGAQQSKAGRFRDTWRALPEAGEEGEP